MASKILDLVVYKIVFSFLIISACQASKNLEFPSTTTWLRILQIQMGNQNGDGMDGRLFGYRTWGGGGFSLELCFQKNGNHCCETGNLNSNDDNWGKGQVNYFLGHQLGHCQNFLLDNDGKFLNNR